MGLFDNLLEMTLVDIKRNTYRRIIYVYTIVCINQHIGNRVELWPDSIDTVGVFAHHVLTKILYGMFEIENAITIENSYNDLFSSYLQTSSHNHVRMKSEDTKALLLRFTDIYVEVNDRYVELHQTLALIYTNLYEAISSGDYNVIVIGGCAVLIAANVIVKSGYAENTLGLRKILTDNSLLLAENFETMNENDMVASIEKTITDKFKEIVDLQQNKVNDFNWLSEFTRMTEDLMINATNRFFKENSAEGIKANVLLKKIMKDSVLATTRFSKFNRVYENYKAFGRVLTDEIIPEPNPVQYRDFDNLITLENFGVRDSNKDNTTVLEPTNITFKAKQFVQIEGASGMGKSLIVLSCVLLGRCPDNFIITGRRSLFDNQAIDPTFTDIKHMITHLECTKNIIPQLTIRGNLCINIQMTEDKKKELDKYLSEFNLDHLREKMELSVTTCSMGEQQRIQLVRMILIDRPIWILDEALSNIDNAGAVNCLNTLRKIQQAKKKTVLYISHIQSIAKDMIDYHIILKRRASGSIYISTY